MAEPASDGCGGCLGVLLAGLVVWLAAGVCGFTAGQKAEREKATEAGVGRYVIDPETGRTDFRYGPEGGTGR